MTKISKTHHITQKGTVKRNPPKTKSEIVNYPKKGNEYFWKGAKIKDYYVFVDPLEVFGKKGKTISHRDGYFLIHIFKDNKLVHRDTADRMGIFDEFDDKPLLPQLEKIVKTKDFYNKYIENPEPGVYRGQVHGQDFELSKNGDTFEYYAVGNNFETTSVVKAGKIITNESTESFGDDDF